MPSWLKFFDDLAQKLEDAYYERNNLPPRMQIPSGPLYNPDTLVPWENVVGSQANRHNVRVLCDLNGLTLDQKNRLTACVRVESNFYPLARGRINHDGTQDFGLAQYNNGTNRHGVPYWIGPGATFASIQDVFNNPKKNIDVMAQYYKATGNLNPWSSYNSYGGKPAAYLAYLGKV